MYVQRIYQCAYLKNPCMGGVVQCLHTSFAWPCWHCGYAPVMVRWSIWWPLYHQSYSCLLGTFWAQTAFPSWLGKVAGMFLSFLWQRYGIPEKTSSHVLAKHSFHSSPFPFKHRFCMHKGKTQLSKDYKWQDVEEEKKGHNFWGSTGVRTVSSKY